MSPKKEPSPLVKQGEIIDSLVRLHYNFTPDEDTAINNDDAPLTTGFKTPRFYFDEGQFKLPPSIRHQEFPVGKYLLYY